MGYTITARRYKWVRRILIIGNALTIYFCVCMLTTSLVRRERYVPYFRIIKEPDEGVEASTVYMITSSVLGLVPPALFFSIYFGYAVLRARQWAKAEDALRRAEEEASGTAMAGAAASGRPDASLQGAAAGERALLMRGRAASQGSPTVDASPPLIDFMTASSPLRHGSPAKGTAEISRQASSSLVRAAAVELLQDDAPQAQRDDDHSPSSSCRPTFTSSAVSLANVTRAPSTAAPLDTQEGPWYTEHPLPSIASLHSAPPSEAATKVPDTYQSRRSTYQSHFPDDGGSDEENDGDDDANSLGRAAAAATSRFRVATRASSSDGTPHRGSLVASLPPTTATAAPSTLGDITETALSPAQPESAASAERVVVIAEESRSSLHESMTAALHRLRQHKAPARPVPLQRRADSILVSGINSSFLANTQRTPGVVTSRDAEDAEEVQVPSAVVTLPPSKPAPLSPAVLHQYFSEDARFRMLRPVHNLCTAVLVPLMAFFGVFWIVRSVVNALDTITTMAEGWDNVFVFYKLTAAQEAKLCSLQLRQRCSGGTTLCNAVDYYNASTAREARCPLCTTKQQATISTFTQSCAAAFTPSRAYTEPFLVCMALAVATNLLCEGLAAYSYLNGVIPSVGFPGRRGSAAARGRAAGEQRQLQLRGPAPNTASLSSNVYAGNRERSRDADTFSSWPSTIANAARASSKSSAATESATLTRASSRKSPGTASISASLHSASSQSEQVATKVPAPESPPLSLLEGQGTVAMVEDRIDGVDDVRSLSGPLL